MGRRKKSKVAKKRQERARATKSLRRFFIGTVLVVLGVSVWAGLTGVNRKMRGDLKNGASCRETTECAVGHLCYSHESASYTCMQKCAANRQCPTGYQCKSVARMMRSQVKPELLCVTDDSQ